MKKCKLVNIWRNNGHESAGFVFCPTLYYNDAVYNESATLIVAQTEGDTGYDYNDAYEDEFYDESGTPA